jgi:hypothetical protein
MNDVTAKLQIFESQSKKATYSRNIWDMQLFNGKIYIGQGDMGVNAGPVLIISFDPTTSKFNTEGVVDEEQINAFKILNGKLVIPGYDPREDWTLGNFYVLEQGLLWTKNRTIPNFIHNNDMEYSNGKLFAVGEPNSATPGIVMSEDFGKTWRIVGDVAALGKVGFSSLFVFKDNLYAVANLAAAQFRPLLPSEYVLKFDGTKFAPVIGGDKLLPGLSRNLYQVERFIVANNQLMYIAVTGGTQRNPIALFVAPELDQARKVVFAEKLALPSDILVRGNKTYVLAYVKNAVNLYTNIVYESTDLITWTETLRFTKDTFARSFEESQGVFYFGLGCRIEAAALAPSTGSMLRVCYSCPCQASSYCAVPR